MDRWRSNCGCHTGANPEWNQKWRAPLRKALDWLRDAVSHPFEERAKQLLHDPWSARNEYIEVVLTHSEQAIDRFLAESALRPLTETEKITILKLMELQRQSMLMYTSCGWFFDDLAGIETVQVMSYAGRVLQLVRELFGQDHGM